MIIIIPLIFNENHIFKGTYKTIAHTLMDKYDVIISMRIEIMKVTYNTTTQTYEESTQGQVQEPTVLPIALMF